MDRTIRMYIYVTTRQLCGVTRLTISCTNGIAVSVHIGIIRAGVTTLRKCTTFKTRSTLDYTAVNIAHYTELGTQSIFHQLTQVWSLN
jgi:hypothetical protein